MSRTRTDCAVAQSATPPRGRTQSRPTRPERVAVELPEALPQQRCWRSAFVGWRLLTEQLDAELQHAFQLSLPEYEVLAHLSDHNGHMRMASLANAMALTPSRVSRTVKRLEAAGLVHRQPCSDDRRGVDARLTEAGQAILTKAVPVHVTGVQKHLLDLCTPEDLEALGRVMDAVTVRLTDDRSQHHTHVVEE